VSGRGGSPGSQPSAAPWGSQRPSRWPLPRQAEAAAFSALPQRWVFLHAGSNPGIGRGPAWVGAGAVFVGRRGAGEGSGVAGEAPAPAALLWGRCCRAAWPSRPLCIPRTGSMPGRAASHRSIPAPRRGCHAAGRSCCSLAASCPESVIFTRLDTTPSKSLQNRICPQGRFNCQSLKWLLSPSGAGKRQV